MDLTRELFVEHYTVTFDENCLTMWPKKSKEPPAFIAECLYGWINKSADITTTLRIFSLVVSPIIERLYGENRGRRPDANLLSGLVYDALNEAGIEVWIRAGSSPTGEDPS